MDAARAAGVFIPLMDFTTQVCVALVLLIGGIRVFHAFVEPQ